MIDILSLADAKAHLRVTGTRFDADLELKIIQTSAIVFNYLKLDMASPLSFPWTGDIPWDVQAAAMLILGDLWRYREGSQNTDTYKFDPISPAVESLLRRWRDPAMA